MSNCLQQRSRWSKGPFQVLFRKNTTYLHPDITPIQRMLFFMTPYGYFTGSLITPALFWVPVFGIVTGFDPFPINFWTITALTVFYGGGRLLVNYSRSWTHLFWTWFATSASIILWPTFYKVRTKSDTRMVAYQTASKTFYQVPCISYVALSACADAYLS